MLFRSGVVRWVVHVNTQGIQKDNKITMSFSLKEKRTLISQAPKPKSNVDEIPESWVVYGFII